MSAIRSLAVLTLLAVPACGTGADAPARSKDQPVAAISPVERGQYIVSTSGCHDCHTPWIMTDHGPGPDMTRALSGHPADFELPPAPAPTGPWIASIAATNTAYAGPWGVSFTANLTPDKDTGLGTWTEQNFLDTIRNGRHLGAGRALLPPMPWPVYKNMTEDDLKAVFAYLQSLPPIKNRVPDPRPPAVASR